MLATHNANAARPGKVGGVAETIKKVENPKFSRSGFDFQARRDWIYRTVHWQLALASRIADAQSRCVIGLHVDELHAIAAEVQAFKAHCAERPSFGADA